MYFIFYTATFLLAAKLVEGGTLVNDPLSNIHSDCLSKYNQSEGIILKTPNFDDGNYPHNKICGWIIETPEEAAGITIEFDYFRLEATKRCSKYDYVALYKQSNGQDKWEATGIEEGYCGAQDPFTITETTKRILIKFVSDPTRNAQGFNATFNIVVTQSSPKIDCVGLLNVKPCNQSVYQEEYSLFLVQAKVRAIPPATYKWEKKLNNTHWTDIRSDIVKNIFPNGSIHFQEIQIQDEGDYRVVATNKHGTTYSIFTFFIKEKCQCPKYITTSWYDYPPYTKYMYGTDKFHNPMYKGIFYAILNNMVSAVCGNCSRGHGVSSIVWDDAINRKKTLDNVKNDVLNEKADIYFPIEGGKLDNKFRNIYYFLPTVDSPGIAFMIIGAEEGASAMAIFDSVLTGWPILVLTVVMAILAGIIMWMLDTYWNEEQFPRNFSEGIVEGFWWAFVTMTTVGYGDIAPVGVPGRVFAIIWILTGLVIIAIFTGVITTSLTVVALSSNLKLYGTKIGAITDTTEYRTGVVKNAKMTDVATFDLLKRHMDERTIEGCLIDSYVAAFHKDKFGKFRVNSIISSNKAYGLVLGKRLSSARLYKKFADYLETNKATVTRFIEENSETLDEPKESAAMEASSDLFDPTSKLFTSSITGSAIIFVVLVIGGLLFEYGYLRPRYRLIQSAKNLEMVESVEVKEMALRVKMLKETLLEEVKKFYSAWGEKLSGLTKKHKAEQKRLLTKGPALSPSKQVKSYHNPQVEEAIELEEPDVVDEHSSPSAPQKSFMSLQSDETTRSSKSLISDGLSSPVEPSSPQSLDPSPSPPYQSTPDAPLQSPPSTPGLDAPSPPPPSTPAPDNPKTPTPSTPAPDTPKTPTPSTPAPDTPKTPTPSTPAPDTPKSPTPSTPAPDSPNPLLSDDTAETQNL